MTGDGGCSIADLVGDVIHDDAQTGVEAETRPAKAEAVRRPPVLGRGVIWCAGAGGAVLLGIAYVFLAIDGLAPSPPMSAAAPAVGLAALVAGGLFGWVGFRCLGAERGFQEGRGDVAEMGTSRPVSYLSQSSAR